MLGHLHFKCGGHFNSIRYCCHIPAKKFLQSQTHTTHNPFRRNKKHSIAIQRGDNQQLALSGPLLLCQGVILIGRHLLCLFIFFGCPSIMSPTSSILKCISGSQELQRITIPWPRILTGVNPWQRCPKKLIRDSFPTLLSCPYAIFQIFIVIQFCCCSSCSAFTTSLPHRRRGHLLDRSTK